MLTLAKIVDSISPDLCHEIIKATEESTFNRATIIAEGGQAVDEMRSSYVCDVPQQFQAEVNGHLNETLTRWSKKVADQYARCASKLYLPGVTPNLDTYAEPPQINRYYNEQEFQYHSDAPLIPRSCDHSDSHGRIISVVVYLNHNFEGGDTLVMEQKFKPVTGKALIFPSNWCFTHCSTPVTKGVKYSLVTWYHAL